MVFEEEAQWDWSQTHKDEVVADLECEKHKANDQSQMQIVLTQTMMDLMELMRLRLEQNIQILSHMKLL